MHGQYRRAEHPVASAVRSLYLACVAANISLAFMHTHSHQGDPGNELVDALAGHCRRCNGASRAPDLVPVLSWPELRWIWMLAQQRVCLPTLDEQGHTPALHVALPDRDGLTTPSRLAGLPDTPAAEPLRIALHLATYNTLSFARVGMLLACRKLALTLKASKALGLTLRSVPPELTAPKVFNCGSISPDPSMRSNSTASLRFVRSTFCIRHADPRRLLVTGCLGDLRLLFVVGHALTSTHTDAEIHEWWTELDSQIRRVPRGFCPIFLLDANARFQAASQNFSATAAHPDNVNAEALQALARTHSVCLSALCDKSGCDIVSWTSPSGHTACIDFIGVPDVWSDCVCTRPAPAGFCDQFAGIDHHPIYLDVEVCLAARVQRSLSLPNVRALRTPAGQARVRSVWQSMPSVPWNVDVDTHLRILNQHLQMGLADTFANQPRVSNPAVCETAWRLLRAQRNMRRQLSRIRGYLQRDVLAPVFGAWRGQLCAAQCIASRARQHRARIRAAGIALQLRACRWSCRAQSKLDQAAFTREMFQTARSREELPHLLRCVLRTGRRYKAPALVPVMETAPGVTCATKASTLAAMPALYRGHTPGAVLQVAHLPTLEDLARAFSGLKSASSWYTALPSQQEIYEAVTGTIPGAPLADLLFQLTFVICLHQVTEELSKVGHCARLPAAQGLSGEPCTNPTWMDDVALLLQGAKCTDVAPALAHAASVTQTMLGATGIAMNLLPGKSEGLVVLHGAVARAERHRLFIELDGKLPFGGERPGLLCLTDCYTHLGVVVGAQCMARKHIERRTKFAELSFLALRRRLLPNPHLSTAEKRELLRSFALGRLTHGLEQWTLEADKDFKAFQTSYMSILRRSVRPIMQCSSTCLRDDQVCAMLRVLTARETHAVALTRSLAQVPSLFPEWHMQAKACLSDVARLLRKFCKQVIRCRNPLACPGPCRCQG